MSLTLCSGKEGVGGGPPGLEELRGATVMQCPSLISRRRRWKLNRDYVTMVTWHANITRPQYWRGIRALGI